MKLKTSDLQGTVLDWAVAKCEPDDTASIYFDESTGEPLCFDDWPDNQEFKPSTDWSQGGPIIERAKIATKENGYGYWFAKTGVGKWMRGPTPLIAAMRCYVASCLGNEVEVPVGLVA